MPNIVSRFVTTAEQYGDKVAIHDPKQSITYHELLIFVRAKASYFRKKGITKGDKVLVMEGMGIPLYANVLALFYIGAAAVFLDKWVTRKNIDTYISSVECAGIIGSRKVLFLSFLHSSLRQIPVKLYAYKQPQNTELAIEEVEYTETALITFTTGSTGIPKAANRTHRILHAQCDALIQEFDPKSDDIDFTTLPIVLFLNLILGRTSVISHQNGADISQMDIEKLIQELVDHKVTSISTSPSVCQALASYIIKEKIPKLALRQIVTGGGPVYHQDAEQLTLAFPDTIISIAYGSTEAEPISSIDSRTIGKYPLQAGLPVGRINSEHASVAILSVGFQENMIDEPLFYSQTLPPSTYGEIVVTGDHVVTNYISKGKYTYQDKILVGEQYWHRTGDAGYIDADGMLFLVGRATELVSVDGAYIAPFVVEAILTQQKGIRRGTIIQRKEKPILYLEKEEDSAIDINHLLTLFPYLKKESISIVKSIPMDPRHHTKIDYKRLKQYHFDTRI